MAEIVGIVSAAVVGISTLIGCSLLPECPISKQIKKREQINIINDPKNDTEQVIKIKLQPVIHVKVISPRVDHRERRANLAAIEKAPEVILQDTQNDFHKSSCISEQLFREKRLSEGNQDLKKSSEVSQDTKSTNNTCYGKSERTFIELVNKLMDDLRELNDHIASSSKNACGLNEKMIIPTHSSDLLVNNGLPIQAFSQDESDESISQNNIPKEIKTLISIDSDISKSENSCPKFTDWSEDDSTERINPPTPSLHSRESHPEANMKGRSYPSTSSRIDTRYAVKNSWFNINRLRKQIGSLPTKIRQLFWSNS